MFIANVLDDVLFQRSRFRLPLHIFVFVLVAAVTSSIPYIFESARSHWRLLILPEAFPTGLNPAPLIHCEPEYHGVLKNTSLSYLRPLVARTKGFYVRDWPIHLGWNNVRYNLEAWLLHAKLLNRTLVVPSHLLTRSCEHAVNVCAAYFPMVNRGDEVHSDEWRILPMTKQMGWRVPIEIMFDFTLLRATHPVITVNDYLRLQGLDPGIERHDGDWDPDAYQYSVSKTGELRNVSLHSIPNAEYEPFGTTRVDRLKGPGIDISQPAPELDIISHILLEKMGNGHALFQEDAEHVLLENNVNRTWSDWETFYLFLRQHGWIGLETFVGEKTTEWMRTVTRPMQQLAPVSKLRGLVDDFGPIDAEVLLIEGETHQDRKAGQLRFTLAAPRDAFSEMVLTHMHPIRPIIELADQLAERMLGMNHGRMWMASHMRRGDFIRWGWTLEQGLADHLKHLKNGLNDGREVLQAILSERDQGRFDKGDPLAGRFNGAAIPEPGDKFFIATDERSPEGLELIRASDAILMEDLMTEFDRRSVGEGWPLLITDVISILEQSLASRAAFFYGQASSSVSGGIVNMRSAQGFDPRCTFIDD